MYEKFLEGRAEKHRDFRFNARTKMYKLYTRIMRCARSIIYDDNFLVKKEMANNRLI